MRIDDTAKTIRGMMDRLRGVVYSRNLAFSALRLAFLKYALDNYIGATSKEELQQCVRAQKMFAMRDVVNGIDVVIPVLRYIDRAYGMDDILSSTENIDEYAHELFGVDRLRQKKNASEDGFRALIEYIGSLDFEEDPEQNVGKMLVDFLLSIIDSTSGKNSFSAENVTNHSVCLLAKELLNIQSNDCFVDFTSGTGVSSVMICGDATPEIRNAEINRVNAAASAMLYIMRGYKSFSISCGDSVSSVVNGLQGNKVFVDPPFSARVERSGDNDYSDSTLAALNRIMHNYLTRDGEAIMTAPSGVLFQSKPQAVGLRNELVDLGMVKAIIALPPMWASTSVNTNLILISKKDMPISDVLFIDATRAVKNERNRNISSNALSQETISQIVDTVNTRKSIEGFSQLVNQNELRKKGYNLVPASYVGIPTEEDETTIEEVNSQLAELYRQLMEQRK